MEFPGFTFCATDKREIKHFPRMHTDPVIHQSKCVNFLHGNELPFARLVQKTGGGIYRSMPYDMREVNFTERLLTNQFQSMHGGAKTLIKSETLLPKKDSYSSVRMFPAVSFSHLVGGFVGSKSQVGSASRDCFQIWDVILRKLAYLVMDPTSKTVMPDSYSFDKDLQQSIYCSLSTKSDTAVSTGSPSLLENFGQVQHPDIYEEEPSKVDKSSVPDILSTATSGEDPQSTLKREVELSLPSVHNPNSPVASIQSAKQSYAEVARAVGNTTNPLMAREQRKSGHGRKDLASRRECKGGYRSQQFRNGKKSSYHRSASDDTHSRREQLGSQNHTRDNVGRNWRDCMTSQDSSSHKEMHSGQDQNATCYWKSWWNLRITRESRVSELQYPRTRNKVCMQRNWRDGRKSDVKSQCRFVNGAACSELQPWRVENPVKMPAEEKVPCTVWEDSSCFNPERSVKGDTVSRDHIPSEGSSTCSSASLHHRLSSECSVDSEDSFVVFENVTGDCSESVDSSELESSWSSSSSEDEDEDDEVDFVPVTDCTNLDPASASRLQEANNLWHQTHENLPASRKVPQKLKFAAGTSLATVHPMLVWDYAYRAARSGPWEEMARDRSRFQARIDHVTDVLQPVLEAHHRQRVWQERFAG